MVAQGSDNPLQNVYIFSHRRMRSRTALGVSLRADTFAPTADTPQAANALNSRTVGADTGWSEPDAGRRGHYRCRPLIQFNDDRGIDVQIPRYAKTVLALTISAAFSACALQTERSSSGPGAVGRTSAPPAPEYEPAQYSSPPDYEAAQYAEPAAVAAAEPEEEELAEEEEVIEEEFADEEEPVAAAVEAEPEVAEAPEPAMPEFTEEAEVEEEPEPEMEEFAMEEEPVAAAEPEAFVAAPVMPEFVEEEEEPAEQVAEQFQPISPPEEESAVTYAEEPGVATDDGIVAQQEYHEEEEGVLADDGIVSQSQYYDEEGVESEEGIVAQSQYYEEEQGGQRADVIGEPQQSDEVMATEVAQEPTPVVLPVTLTLEAEPWFDFDRSVLRSDGRRKLDELLNGLKDVEYETILVVGHADRIGTNSYNQALSLRRANAVKSYLASKGVPTDRVQAEGRGEFEPSTNPNTCTGMRKRSLIDCLQPDRRVEVTVTGQRMAQQ